MASVEARPARPNAWKRHHGISIGSPHAVTVGSDQVALFGVGTNHDVRVQWKSKAGWSRWDSLGGPMVTIPFAISRSPQQLDVFCVDPAHTIRHLRWDGSEWSDWTTLDGQAGGPHVTPPHAVAWGPDRLDLFVYGTDHGIYHNSLTAETWSGWDPIGQEMASPPFAVARRPGILEVFAVGREDRFPKRKIWRDGKWEERWDSLSESTAISTPSAVVRSTGEVEVFFRGEERGIYHSSSDSPTAKAKPLEGVATQDPCVICWPDDKLDLFVVGEDSRVWNRGRRDGQWSKWTPLDGHAFSVVSALLRSASELELFILGDDSHIWSRTFSHDELG
jgi:hypothetical protein